MAPLFDRFRQPSNQRHPNQRHPNQRHPTRRDRTPGADFQRRGAWLGALLLGLGLSVLLFVSGGGGVAAAAERQLELQEFQMVGELMRDGSVKVSETLTARFQGKWNGLRREIPVLARFPDGIKPLGLHAFTATNEAGRPCRVETRGVGDNREWRIYVPGAQDATRTVVLRYRVRNAVRFFPDHDELNWNVTGNAWEIPIDRVDAQIWLPLGVKGLHASVYTGSLGAKGQDARLVIGDRVVRAESTRGLRPGEGLTLAVGFDKGLLSPPSALARGLGWLQGRLALLLPPLITLIFGTFWWLYGRDPALGSVPVVYEPPGGLSAAVLGSLLKERVGSVTLGATLVDLAVKGHLRIEPLAHKPLLLTLSKHYRFTLLTNVQQWKELAPHEAFLLEHLFPKATAGDSIDTTELRNSFYLHVPGFQRLVREAAMKEGFYLLWPTTLRSITISAGIGGLALLVALALKLLPHEISRLQMAADQPLSLLCLLVSLLLIVVFGWFMPSRTEKGTVMLRKTLGFKEFIRRVDSPRYSKVIRTPELFERFLPYAMVAGLTQRWAAAFQGIVQAPPTWYAGGDGPFSVGDFGSSLEACCGSTCSAMQSTPGSSGGSSGGGFSGGGVGGGGGGGF